MQAVVTLSLKVLPTQGPKKSIQHYKWTWPDSCQDRGTGLSLTQTFSFSSWTGINMFMLSPFWGCFNGHSCYHYHKGQGFSVAGEKQQEVVLFPDSWCWTPQMLIIMSDSVTQSGSGKHLDLQGHHNSTLAPWKHSLRLCLLGGVVNSLDFCLASLKSLGCFYFQCILSSQWNAVIVDLQILHCQL